MQRISIYVVLTTLAIGTLYNCSGGGGGDDGPPNPPPPVVVDPPGTATLVFPEQNSECTEGSNFTDTESDVTFDWNDSANTTSYQLVLKNLETQTISNHNSSVSQLTLRIFRATPYSWYIVSSNSGTTTRQSATWKFYNAGDAVTSYAPFPAELVSPDMGSSLSSSTTVAGLDWNGSDVDNDIVDYEVFFGTVDPPVTSLGITSDSDMTATVSSGDTYYWIVITNDSEGNTSQSETFQFKVN